VRHNNELLQPELFTIRAVEGIAARRQLLYIDPLLEFVAYLEVVTQAFVPAGVNDASTVTTSGTKAAVVFERKGQVFFRQALAGVAEASVTGGKGLGWPPRIWSGPCRPNTSPCPRKGSFRRRAPKASS
jgi:hypothetical protein